jgi:hypothetical protein
LNRASRASWCRAAAVLLAIFGARPVHAEPTAEEIVLAESLFREGRRLFEAGAYVEACAKLGESQRLDPGGGTLLNLARCHEAQGKLATAWAEFQEARTWARRDGRQDRQQTAEEHLTALEPRLSWLTLRAPAATAVTGLEIRIDDTAFPAAALGVPWPIDPGTHRITIKASGKLPQEITLRVNAERERRNVTIAPLIDAPTAQGRAPRPAVPGRTAGENAAGRAVETRFRTPVLSYVLGASGLVFIGVGSAFGLRAIDLMSQSDDECPNGVCTRRGSDLSHQANTNANWANAGFGVGVASLAAAVIVYVVAKHRHDTTGREPSSRP